jgi:hypothetical protein
MYWNNLPGSELLKRIFSYPVPIGKISLFDIHINRDGPTIRINFDLINLVPDLPPLKWKMTPFNRCRLGLNCSNFTNLEIIGWDFQNIVEVTIDLQNNGAYKLHYFGEKTNIRFDCSDLIIVGPSVYLS